MQHVSCLCLGPAWCYLHDVLVFRVSLYVLIRAVLTWLAVTTLLMSKRQLLPASWQMGFAFRRYQPHHNQFHGSLLLLKAQASAMIGNLAAADEAVQAWQNDPSTNHVGNLSHLSIPSRRNNTPACWRESWSASAAAKDKGNDLFRQGDFAGD